MRQVGSTERNGNREASAATFGALNTDRAPVKLHEFLHQRKPYAAAFETAAFLTFDAMKTFKQARQFMFGDADASVTNGQFSMAIALAQVNCDFALESELECVREKIEHDLLPHLRIHIDLLIERGAIDHKPQPRPGARRFEVGGEVGRQPSEVARS